MAGCRSMNLLIKDEQYMFRFGISVVVYFSFLLNFDPMLSPNIGHSSTLQLRVAVMLVVLLFHWR